MMISKSKLFSMSLIVLFLLSFTALNAQVKGVISGRVTDASSGDYLPGANVTIQGTNFGSSTDRSGVFRINNVPPGTFTLVVSYIGYEDFSTEVNVTAGDVTKQDIALKVSYVQMEQVVVEGLRQGQVKALSQQRTANNIQNVVSQELMERFPDENTADVLKRIPGVYIQNSLGEGRYALIRGTDSRLNTITVNGEKLATNRTEERFPQLDIIGASQLASVEVVKALTPDMDGDAIGGSINLVTRSAFDYTGRKIDFTLGSGYTDIDGKLIGQGKVHYSDIFGANQNIGLTFTANWDRKVRGTHNSEPEWNDQEDINGNEIPYALSDITFMDYNTIFARYGVGTGLEYRPNDNNRFYVNALFSQFNDETLRGRYRLRIDKGDYLNEQGTLTEKSRLLREHTWRLEELIQQQYSAGGFHKFGDKQLDYSIAYSYADETHEPQYASEWDFDEKVDLSLDLSRPEAPLWDILNIEDNLQFDPSLYELSQVDYRNTYASNSHVTGAVNFKMPYELAGYPSEFKLGLKARFEEKDRDDDRWQYKWEGDNNVFMDQFKIADEEKDFFDDQYANFGPVPDQDDFEEWFKANQDGLLEGELRYWDSEGQNFIANEDVYAYYAMTTVNIGDLMVLGGFRHEFTQNDYEGTELYFDDDGDFSSMERVNAKRDYNNFLPMIHFRYRFAPLMNLRFAYTRTLSRPNFWDFAPYFYVDPSGEEIAAGNPDLKPTTAHNIDLMFENYFQDIGIASGGFFYKKLDDIIFVQTSDIEGGVWDGFEKEQAINGGSADLFGFELNWQQELSFLPGPLSGLGIYANYTHTEIKTNIFEEFKDILPGYAPDVGNIALAYEKYGFSARLSASYRDKFITALGQDDDRHEWTDEHMQLDFSASYNITPWVQAYFEAINLTNEPAYEYMGVRERPTVVEYFSWWMKGGLKFRFGE